MRLTRLSIAPLFIAVVACGGAPDPQPQPSETAAASAEPDMAGPERHILAFGDSLFAGYGLGEREGYPERLQVALRQEGINARVVDAGVSGDTSAAGRQRLAFTLDAQQSRPDLVMLELGANDMLRGLSPKETRANIDAMLQELKERGIPVLLMGMRAPPNYGPDYQRDFDGLYGDLAGEYDAQVIPFWLESIYQRPELFQADRLHPTAKGVDELVAATKASVVEALPPLSGE